MKLKRISLALLIAVGVAAAPVARAQEKTPKKEAGKSAKKGGKKGPETHQADVASKTAKFGTVAKKDKAYTAALDAHKLDEGKKLIGKPGSIKGTVDKLFEPGSGSLCILNFDPDYKKALVAVVQKDDYTKFPVLKDLVGKEVVVSGKFIDYNGVAELQISKPGDIRIVK